MTLAEILKALEDAEVKAEVIEAIKGLDDSSRKVEELTKELEAERGKHAGILEDKRKFKERAEAAEGKVKELEQKDLSAEERAAAKVEELERKLEEEKQLREKRESEFTAQQREAAIGDLTGKIRWAKDTPQSTAKLIVKTAFEGMEDLSDEKAVEAKLKEIRESHKAFISAETPAGGGSGNDRTGTPGDADEATMEDLVAEAWGK